MKRCKTFRANTVFDLFSVGEQNQRGDRRDAEALHQVSARVGVHLHDVHVFAEIVEVLGISGDGFHSEAPGALGVLEKFNGFCRREGSARDILVVDERGLVAVAEWKAGSSGRVAHNKDLKALLRELPHV